MLGSREEGKKWKSYVTSIIVGWNDVVTIIVTTSFTFAYYPFEQVFSQFLRLKE